MKCQFVELKDLNNNKHYINIFTIVTVSNYIGDTFVISFINTQHIYVAKEIAFALIKILEQFQ